MLTKSDTTMQEAVTTVYQLSQEEKIRQQCEAREDYYRRTNGRERLLKNLISENERLRSEIKQLTLEHEQLTLEREQLTLEHEQLTLEHEQLTLEREQLKAEIARKKAAIAEHQTGKTGRR